MSLRIIFLIAVALVLGAGTYWFLQNFERVHDRHWVGMSGEAKRNPFLAAQRTLQRLGKQTDQAKALVEANQFPTRGVVVMSDRRDALTPVGQKALLQWVADGGHLVTEDRHVDKSDRLLDALGVNRRKGKQGERSTVTVKLPHDERAYEVQMHAVQSLLVERPLLSVARNGDITHVLHFRYGRGYVTVFNDLYFMTNHGIDEADHADFLRTLMQVGGATGPIVFYDNLDSLSLKDWLMANAWPVLLSAALLLGLWLWRIVPRFGPVAEEPDRNRRSLLEHLNASGHFQWNNGAGPQLAEAARELVMRRFYKSYPTLVGSSNKALAADLRNRFSLNDEQVQRLVSGGNVRSVPQFVSALRLYQQIHKRLALRRAGEKE